jgi:hypothetical protein
LFKTRSCREREREDHVLFVRDLVFVAVLCFLLLVFFFFGRKTTTIIERRRKKFHQHASAAAISATTWQPFEKRDRDGRREGDGKE